MIGSPSRSNHTPICSECDWIRIRSRQPVVPSCVGRRRVSYGKAKRSASTRVGVDPRRRPSTARGPDRTTAVHSTHDSTVIYSLQYRLTLILSVPITPHEGQ